MEPLEVFEKLKTILTSLDDGLEIKKNTPEYYYLNTNKEVNGKEMFFGAVQIRKSYIAFHLFPVYTNPELLDEISPELRKRMQGKSCFNFKKEVSPGLLSELKNLTSRSYKKFVERGYIENFRTK